MSGCLATLRSGQRSGQRCCRRTIGGESFCGLHRSLSRTEFIYFEDLVNLVENLESLDIKKPSVVVEVEYMDKFYCGICLEDVDSKNAGWQLNCCKKGACTGCLQNWANESHTCPYCRAEIK